MDGRVDLLLFVVQGSPRGQGRIRALSRPNCSLVAPFLPFLFSRARRKFHCLRFSGNAVEFPSEEGDASRPHESSAFLFSASSAFLFLRRAAVPFFASLSTFFLSFFFFFFLLPSFLPHPLSHPPHPHFPKTATPRPTSASTTASTPRPSPR